jgi:hypothetical protein
MVCIGTMNYMLKLADYAQALGKWCEIEKEANCDALNRIQIFGRKWIYVAATTGELYQWRDGEWHNVMLCPETSDEQSSNNTEEKK